MTLDIVAADLPTVVPGELAASGQYRAFTDAWLANRRLSPETVAAYRRDVHGWLDWCAGVTAGAGPVGRREPVDPLSVAFVHVNEYARALEATVNPRSGQQYTPATVARKLSAISSWYDYLGLLSAVTRNPVAGTDRPRIDASYSATVGLSEAEASALIAEADLDRYAAATRTRALVRFLVRVGPRVSEATGANVGDLGVAEGMRVIILRMKGGKTRRRRVPEQTAASIDEMLVERAAAAGLRVDQLDPAAPLFATTTGGRMQRSEVYELIRRLARSAGLANWKDLSPHSLRHAWNTIAKLNGAELEERQQALGHGDPGTTQRYDRDKNNLHRDPSILVERATSMPNH